MIIYIHGFGSNGLANKAKLFRKYFENEKFIAPSLSNIPDLAIQTLKEIINLCEDEVYLIGSSLGGYYATHLSILSKVKKVILINPAVYSSNTLKRAMPQGINYYDESKFEWNENHLNSLKELEVAKIDKNKFFVLLQKGDEVLDYKDAMNKFDGAKMVIEDGGNHSFKGIENHFEEIRKIIKYKI